MYSSKSYSIDDIVKYSSRRFNGTLNYLVSKSESYSFSSGNNLISYHGQDKKPLIYSQTNDYKKSSLTKTYYFTPELFLNPIRPSTQFINATEQIQELIEETFSLMIGRKLPKNVSIRVCTKEELKQIHSRLGHWDEGIQGFALNDITSKQIFVKNSHLDALMLTIGHEIGHVYTSRLSNSHDEEAKAFSFAVEWAKTIKKNNIGNLGENIKDDIDFNPARNGLHDLAFFFVKKLINNGLRPMQIHWDLVNKYTSLFGFYN